MNLHESGEDYLEMILMLQKEKGIVRSIDVATAMGFSKASVSRAISIFKKEGFLVMEKSGELVLTPKGLTRATEVLDRHLCITKYIHLVLGVDLAIADHDACRIEHIISPETFAKIKEKISILESTTK